MAKTHLHRVHRSQQDDDQPEHAISKEGRPMMFSVQCARHGSEVLLGARNVFGFTNTDEGPVIAWRCDCGQVGLLGRLGEQEVHELQPTVPIAA
jgi:hypothetical protein